MLGNRSGVVLTGAEVVDRCTRLGQQDRRIAASKAAAGRQRGQTSNTGSAALTAAGTQDNQTNGTPQTGVKNASLAGLFRFRDSLSAERQSLPTGAAGQQD